MNTYAITYQNGNIEHTINLQGNTPSKAKSAFYKEMSDCWNCTFIEAISVIKHCRKIGPFHPSHLFGDPNSFDHMKSYRDIPFAHMGMRVEVSGKPGTLVGNHGDNLLICFDDEHWGTNCHPGYQTKYYATDGTILMDNTKPDQSPCADCRYLPRCSRLLNRTAADIGCDFSPPNFNTN